MSEKEFRPHFSSKEIQYLLRVVKYAEHFLDAKEREYNSLEARLYELHKQVQRGNTSNWKELKPTKEQLQDMRGLPMWILHQRFMCRSLTCRLESILRGGKAHRHSLYGSLLNQALSEL